MSDNFFHALVILLSQEHLRTIFVFSNLTWWSGTEIHSSLMVMWLISC